MNNFIVEATVADLSSLPKNSSIQYTDAQTFKLMDTMCAATGRSFHHGIESKYNGDFSGRQAFSYQMPPYYARCRSTTEAREYFLNLSLRLLKAFSSALQHSGKEFAPRGYTFIILYQIFTVFEKIHPELVHQIFDAIPVKVLLELEFKGLDETTSSIRHFIRPLNLILHLLPGSKRTLLNLLNNCDNCELKPILGPLIFEKNSELSSKWFNDKELISRLHKMYPAEIEKRYGHQVLIFQLTKNPAPVAAPAPVSSASSSSRAAISERDQIAYLSAKLDAVTRERDALQAENAALKAALPSYTSDREATAQMSGSSSSSSSAATYLPSQRSAGTYNPPMVIDVPIEEDELGEYVRRLNSSY